MNLFKNNLDKQWMESTIRSSLTESIFWSVMLMDPYLVSVRRSGILSVYDMNSLVLAHVCIYMCIIA